MPHHQSLIRGSFRRKRRSSVRANIRVVSACFVAFLIVLLVTGCETERVTTSDGRPMAGRPRPAPSTPQSARITRMAFMVGSKPEDTTGNGYPDLIRATVVLFAEPHPTSVSGDGTFEFRLFPFGTVGQGDAEPLASWRFEGEDVQRTLARGLYGPAHQFQLSLLEVGGDVLPLQSVDLRCTFIPANGDPPVHSDGARPIRIGRR